LGDRDEPWGKEKLGRQGGTYGRRSKDAANSERVSMNQRGTPTERRLGGRLRKERKG